MSADREAAIREPLTENERLLAKRAWESAGDDARRWGNLMLEVYDAQQAELAAARERNEKLRGALRQAPIPQREQNIYTPSEWDEFYAAWFHDHASDAAVDGRSVVPGGLRELASSVNDPAKRASALSEGEE